MARESGKRRKRAQMKVPAASIYFPPEDRAAILSQFDEILQTGQLTLGTYERQFEERFAATRPAWFVRAVFWQLAPLGGDADLPQPHLLAAARPRRPALRPAGYGA